MRSTLTSSPSSWGKVLKPYTDSQPRGVFPENTMEQGLSTRTLIARDGPFNTRKGETHSLPM